MEVQVLSSALRFAPQGCLRPGISLDAMKEEVRTPKRRENDPNVRFLNAELRCCGCGTVSRDTRFWAAYLIADEPPHVTVFCPACAREFD